MSPAEPIPTLDHLARLARLALTPEERALFEPQLARILDYARRVLDVDTTGVEPTDWTGSGPLPERPDETRPGLSGDEALEPSADTDRTTGLFRVPRVLAR